MNYNTYNLMVEIDGFTKFIEIDAVSLDSALADVKEAFSGEVVLKQYGIGG